MDPAESEAGDALTDEHRAATQRAPAGPAAFLALLAVIIWPSGRDRVHAGAADMP
jgi:hypothetical protein